MLLFGLQLCLGDRDTLFQHLRHFRFQLLLELLQFPLFPLQVGDRGPEARTARTDDRDICLESFHNFLFSG